MNCRCCLELKEKIGVVLGLYCCYIGIIENKMETAILGLGFKGVLS